MEASNGTLAAIIAGALGLLAAISAYRRERTSDTVTLTGEYRQLVTELKGRVADLEAREAKRDERIEALEKENQHLQDGVGILINQLAELGHKPKWTLAQLDNNHHFQETKETPEQRKYRRGL